MNILTFDIEEWYAEMVLLGDRQDKYVQYDKCLNDVLDLLDEYKKKATFFCVGSIATTFPHVVKAIQSRGHEIGCHSHRHMLLHGMSRDEVLDDTRHAVNALEQCTGEKVKSYRAPAFSIGSENKWVFEILSSCGIERDASVFPASRDFGGYPGFGHKEPVKIACDGIEIKEFPISTMNVLGKEIAFSGGGYFRFIPFWLFKREMAKNKYNMCYFHIDDLLQERTPLLTREEYEDYFKEEGSLVNRVKRNVKDNYGKKGAWEKLKRLIKEYDFLNLDAVDQSIDWASRPVVE